MRSLIDSLERRTLMSAGSPLDTMAPGTSQVVAGVVYYKGTPEGVGGIFAEEHGGAGEYVMRVEFGDSATFGHFISPTQFTGIVAEFGDGNDVVQYLQMNDITDAPPITVALGAGDDYFMVQNYGGDDARLMPAVNVDGGAGRDRLNGGNNADVLRGGSDHDEMAGGAGDDVIYGDDGDDLLDGGAGNDRLYGGKGDDILIGGDGRDVLAGQGGTDTLIQ